MTDHRLERGAGILLPVSSLPSPFGIGTFGQAAYDFIDFLKAAGQKYWQVLPLGPTSYGDSPYQSFSAFAGNRILSIWSFLSRRGFFRSAGRKRFSGERTRSTFPMRRSTKTVSRC